MENAVGTVVCPAGLVGLPHCAESFQLHKYGIFCPSLPSTKLPLPGKHSHGVAKIVDPKVRWV